MTVLIKRRYSRRRMLKGMLGGSAVGVGLPILDCFLNDNGTALASGAPIPVRFGTWFWGLGHTPGRGIALKGPEIEFLEECRPLEPHKSHINYFSNFATPTDGDPSGVHFTGWVAARTGSLGRNNGVLAPTLDSLVADGIGAGTRFRSLELSATGNPDDSYTFRSAGARNTAEVSPLAFYSRIFGPDFNDPNAGSYTPDSRVMLRQSALSAVIAESKSFAQSLGAEDKARLEEYFTSIRQLEQQLALQLEKPEVGAACQRPSAPDEGPLGVEFPVALRNHKLLTELLVMALACHQTNVFNMLYSQSLSLLRPPGQAFTHHTLTHEEPIDQTMGCQRQVAEFNVVSMEALATFISAFRAVKEGDGTLLDNTLIFANTDTNDARTHAIDGVPMMTVGRAGGRIKTGLHVLGQNRPTTQVGLTAMQVMGIPIQKWGVRSLQVSEPIAAIMS